MIVACAARVNNARNVGSNFVRDIVALPEIIESYNTGRL
jgi:Lrp/AsnC family leucine-responsive transcriptional regulator